MARALRLSIVLALFPGILGFKGCYFGNDQVPLGSNAEDADAGAADSSAAAGAGGGGDAGRGGRDEEPPNNPIVDLEVVAFSFGLELATRAEGGAAGQPEP